MRADRLLSILLLLQTHARLTGRELASRLEVSGRTIHRDMEALSAAAGVPVVAERRGRGWLVPSGVLSHRSDGFEFSGNSGVIYRCTNTPYERSGFATGIRKGAY